MTQPNWAGFPGAPVSDRGMSGLLDGMMLSPFDGMQLVRKNGVWAPVGGWEPIGVYQITAQSSYPILNLGAFRAIRAHASLLQNTSNGNLYLQASTDNGQNYDTTNYQSQYSFTSSGTATHGFGSAAGYSLNAIATLAGDRIAVVAEISDFNQPNASLYTARNFEITAGPSAEREELGGRHTTSVARNALRLTASAGTVTGFLVLEGVRG